MNTLELEGGANIERADAAERHAREELTAAEAALRATLEGQTAEDLLARPGAVELDQARQRVTDARRVLRDATAARDAVHAAVRREQAEAARQQRAHALDAYQADVDRAAASWSKVMAHEPIAGLGPAKASPEGALEFRTWRAKNVP